MIETFRKISLDHSRKMEKALLRDLFAMTFVHTLIDWITGRAQYVNNTANQSE